MADYWKVSPKLWNKPWTNDAKLLALYLLTNQHRVMEGLYRLPKAYICADLDWTEKRLSKPFEELTNARFIKYENGIVLIRKTLKYQAPENPNQIVHALKALEQVGDTQLIVGLWAAAERFCKPFAKRLRERFPKPFAKGLVQPLPKPFGKPPSPSPATEKIIASSLIRSNSISAHPGAILDDTPEKSDSTKAEANLPEPQKAIEDEKPKPPLAPKASFQPPGRTTPQRGEFKSMASVAGKMDLPRSDSPPPPRETLDSYLRTVCPGISQEQRETLQRWGFPLTEAYKVISVFQSQTNKKPIGNRDSYLWSMLKNAAMACAKASEGGAGV